MKEIQLKDRTILEYYFIGIANYIAPTLVERVGDEEIDFLSERKIRLHGIRNFENVPSLISDYHCTSTLSATKGKNVKVILPYETGSNKLTDVSSRAWGWVNTNELVDCGGVNLDVKGKWDKLEGSGVYTRQKDEWFEKGEKGVLIGLNENMTEEQAEKCPILQTKLGHPDYVDAKFKKSADEVAEIIGKTFELGKQEYGRDTMLGQYLPGTNNKGFLSAWHTDRLCYGAGSYARSFLDHSGARFGLNSSIIENKGSNIDYIKDKLKTLEGMLKKLERDERIKRD